jgi:hypothetical protein
VIAGPVTLSAVTIAERPCECAELRRLLDIDDLVCWPCVIREQALEAEMVAELEAELALEAMTPHPDESR